MKLRIFICFLVIFQHQNLIAQTPGSRLVRNFTADPAIEGSGKGICVTDLSSGNILVSEGQDKLLVPASTLKLVISATPPEVLGPEYRFKTEMGYSGTIYVSGKLHEGNLVIRGGGDPNLGSVWFEDNIKPDGSAEKWIEELKNAGIERFTGDLILDLSAYENYSIPGSWLWEGSGIPWPFFIEDGSGLSRDNAIPVKFLDQVLQAMHKSRYSAVFKSSLAVAGKVTLSSFQAFQPKPQP